MPERLSRVSIRELAKLDLGEPVSDGRRDAPPKETPLPIDLIVAATSSSRRKNLILHVSGGLPMITLPLGEDELDTTIPRKVVKDKLRRARIRVSEEREAGGRIPRNMRVAIIAADTLSGPLALNRLGEPILKHQSKPRTEAKVWRVFRQMQKAVSAGESPYYKVISSSGIAFDPTDGDEDFIPESQQEARIDLGRDAVAYLNTTSGRGRYLAELNSLYGSDIYTNGGDLEIITLRDLAAGLSIPVLTRINAVEAINRVPRDHPDFPTEYQKALDIASAGIDDLVLAAINPNAPQLKQTWPFLQRMTDYALGAQA